MTGPRLALWAGGSLDNLGDRLLARVTETELAGRLPGARLRHFCPWSRARDPEPLWIDAHGRWPGTGRFDAVVLAGGGVFSGPPFRHPLMQLFCLGRDPALFDPGVPVFWHGVGLQDGTPPLPHDDVSGDYLRALAGRVGMLTVRDRGAAARFASAGVEARLVPDPVFALAPLPPETTGRAAARPVSRSRRPRIGVAVGTPHPTPRLIARLAAPDLVERCPPGPGLCLSADQVVAAERDPDEQARRAGFTAGLARALADLSGEADLDLLGVPNIYSDEVTTARLAAALPGARVRALPADDLDRLQATIAEYDAVLVSRYHTAILALRVGTPTVVADPFFAPALGTSKLHDLMTRLGLARRYWTNAPDSGAAPDLADAVRAALADEPVEAAAYRAQHDEAVRSFDRLADALRGALAPEAAEPDEQPGRAAARVPARP